MIFKLLNKGLNFFSFKNKLGKGGKAFELRSSDFELFCKHPLDALNSCKREIYMRAVEYIGSGNVVLRDLLRKDINYDNRSMKFVTGGLFWVFINGFRILKSNKVSRIEISSTLMVRRVFDVTSFEKGWYFTDFPIIIDQNTELKISFYDKKGKLIKKKVPIEFIGMVAERLGVRIVP